MTNEEIRTISDVRDMLSAVREKLEANPECKLTVFLREGADILRHDGNGLRRHYCDRVWCDLEGFRRWTVEDNRLIVRGNSSYAERHLSVYMADILGMNITRPEKIILSSGWTLNSGKMFIRDRDKPAQ